MQPLGNDEWTATSSSTGSATYEYTVHGWVDRFESWRHDRSPPKSTRSQDVSSDLLEGAALVRATAGRARAASAPDDARWLDAQADLIDGPRRDARSRARRRSTNRSRSSRAGFPISATP